MHKVASASMDAKTMEGVGPALVSFVLGVAVVRLACLDLLVLLMEKAVPRNAAFEILVVQIPLKFCLATRN